MELSASQLWMSQSRSGPEQSPRSLQARLPAIARHLRRSCCSTNVGCSHWLSGCSATEDAQDAAQEVFLRAFKYLRGFDSSKPLEPWLVRMTVNVCRGAGRKRSRSREVFVDGDGFQGEDPGKNPYAQLRTEEQKRFLYEALEGLAEKERTAIVLRDIEGLTTAEVAEILGSAEATVRSQISVARLKMRKAIARMKGGRDVL